MSGASTPSAAGTTRTRLPRLREREPIELALHALASTNGMDAAEQPAEHHHLRVEDVDQAGQPEAQPAPDGVERLEHVGRARGGLAEDGLDLLAAGVGGMAGAAQQRALADLGLPAADRAAAARAAVGVDRHVADLAGEPARRR